MFLLDYQTAYSVTAFLDVIVSCIITDTLYGFLKAGKASFHFVDSDEGV